MDRSIAGNVPEGMAAFGDIFIYEAASAWGKLQRRGYVYIQKYPGRRRTGEKERYRIKKKEKERSYIR